jgi:hypothetical protein
MLRNTPTFVLSIIGTLTGTAGIVLSILNYLRDRASGLVSLQWDFQELGPNNQPTGQPVGVVAIANNGRRPLYIKLVFLEVPKRSGHGPVILKRSLQGHRLAEGDPELVIPISSEAQSALRERFATYWREIYAVAADNCGHQYRSKPPKKQPSWAQLKPAADAQPAPK